MSYRISPEAVVPLLARCLVTHGSMEAIQNFITEYNQKTGTRGNLLAERIGEQAKHFGVKPEDIPASGKKATEYTLELLKKGETLVRTLGTMGEDAPGSANDPQRRYALVEVSTPDGNRRMLYELLIENGLARAHGQAAPWPERTARHLGEEKAKEWFMKNLERIEKKARNDGRGI